MRVIAGSARRLLLVTVDGNDTRPTGDKIKETLFNMLNFELPGAVFVDLYSGSGAIAIEALSRGAEKAYLVENNRKAAACIQKNLETTRFTEQGELMICDVMAGIRKLEGRGVKADIIFMDPPYNHEYEKNVLERLRNSPLVDESTLIVVEASKETEFDYAQEFGYQLEREKVYKSSKHEFFRRKSTAAETSDNE